MSPLERVRFWEKVIDWLPKIFESKRKLEEKVRAHEMSPTDAAANLAWQMRHVFPPGYALRNLDSELAAARCALSKARWQLMAWQRTGRIPGERQLLQGAPALRASADCYDVFVMKAAGYSPETNSRSMPRSKK
jgi:hypothetical protein